MRDKQEMLVMYAVLYPQDDKDEHRSYSMRHFVITDKGNDHLPWDYIIDRELFLEQVAGGSFFPFDFVRHETMDIYLTDNLWTCAMPDWSVHPRRGPPILSPLQLPCPSPARHPAMHRTRQPHHVSVLEQYYPEIIEYWRFTAIFRKTVHSGRIVNRSGNQLKFQN
jgi:hypothetical protein